MNLEPGARVWGYMPPPPDVRGHRGLWEQITLGATFDTGGTAKIHKKEPFPNSGKLIKIFSFDMADEARKAFYAKVWRMSQLRLKLNERIPMVAWPDAIVLSQQTPDPACLLGCTVPLFPNATSLTSIAIDFETLVSLAPKATPDTQKLIALNIIEGFERLHSREVLFGDPNAQNILINTDTFDVKFIDADSYGMTLIPPGESREVYFPPPATTIGFRSPRTAILSGPQNKQVSDYGKSDDNYTLAIHLFMLLVPGFHPWNGMSLQAEENARHRRFAYAGPHKSLPDTCVQMQAFNSLPTEITDAFVRAFVNIDPPTATTWRALFSAHWGHLQAQSRRLRYGPVLATAARP
jgi:DNA-binding helix-hairpin-helix protein with protein kinase domain